MHKLLGNYRRAWRQQANAFTSLMNFTCNILSTAEEPTWETVKMQGLRAIGNLLILDEDEEADLCLEDDRYSDETWTSFAVAVQFAKQGRRMPWDSIVMAIFVNLLLTSSLTLSLFQFPSLKRWLLTDPGVSSRKRADVVGHYLECCAGHHDSSFCRRYKHARSMF